MLEHSLPFPLQSSNDTTISDFKLCKTQIYEKNGTVQ